MRARRALIACGGFGTRLLPATKAVPKALLPVVDRPLLQYAIEELAGAGFTDIGVLYRADQTAIPSQASTSTALREQLLRLGKLPEMGALSKIERLARIHLFPSSDESLGLGGQLLQIADFLRDAPFALLFVDELCDPGSPVFGILDAASQTYALTVVATLSDPRGPPLSLVDSVPSLETAKPGSSRAPPALPRFIGRMLCTPQLIAALRFLRSGRSGPIDVMDGLRVLAQRRSLLARRYDGRWWDCGDKAGYLDAFVTLAMEHDATDT